MGLRPASMRGTARRARLCTLALAALGLAGCARVTPTPFQQPARVPPYWGLPVGFKTVEPWTAVVLPMRGAYSQTNETLRRVRLHLTSKGVAFAPDRFGRYFSDPQQAREADLRWEVGYAVPPGTQADLPFEIRNYPSETVAFAIVQGPYAEGDHCWPEFFRRILASGYQPYGPGMAIWRGNSRLAGAEGPQTELRVVVWRVPIAQRLAIHLVCTWGASIFVLFALLYLRQEHRRRLSFWGGYLGAAVASGSALFYLSPILWELAYLYGGWLGPVRDWANALSLAALPLFMHLWYHVQRDRLPGRFLFRSAILAMYAIGGLLAADRVLNLFSPEWSARFDPVVAGLVLAIAVFGLAVELAARSASPAAPRAAERRVQRGLLVATAILGLIGMTLPDVASREYAYFGLRFVPLAFLFSAAYFNERVLFFDVLVKRGAFVLALLLALSGYFLFVPGWLYSTRLGWVGAWVFPLSAAPLIAGAPWAYAGLSAFIDRRWLGRTCSPGEAYRGFVASLAAANTEEDLRRAAEDQLAATFQAGAEVELGAAAPASSANTTGARQAAVTSPRGTWGVVRVNAGSGSRPFLSEDQVLLDTMAHALGLAVENVRLHERRVDQERRERELALNASRSELKALRAQINPHFLFNALNSIAALIACQPDQAEATVERLAEIFRYTLRRADKEWVCLEDELAFVRCYLDIEKTRFGERLEVRISGEGQAADALLPAMIVQTLVENAVKHGVAPMRERGKVEIEAGRARGRLWVEVRDNGPGFPADQEQDAPRHGHGLRNVRERLRGHFGQEARLVVERSASERLTLVRIEMPYLTAPPTEVQIS
jgi:signal transduction histidine kinase